jgi:hypothetical protein
MTQRRSPLAAGLSAAFTYRRLAGVLWLGLVLSALPAWFAFGPLFAPVDAGPFRESVLRGWDSWAFLSFLGSHPRETGVAFAAVGFGVLLSFVLDLLLTTGAVRVLLSGLPRPALRRTVVEGASLFRPVLLAWVRWAFSLALWLGLLVAAPLALLSKAAGANAPPNGPLATVAFLWAVVASLGVLASTSVRFSLARVALARGEASTVRAAFRASKGVLRGGRGRAAGIWLFWFAGSLALQAVFTAAGVAMNPATGPGVAALVVVRQLGFGLFAATRVGYQASLIAFGEARRPLPPLPLAHPVAAAAPAVPEASPAA